MASILSVFSVEVEVTGDDITISGGSLPYTYKLDQFHFHWGSEDNTGSEHTVDSMHAPMEVWNQFISRLELFLVSV